MRAEATPAGYRRFYDLLLRLYPKPYRERFGEGMGQTFTDLCRERAAAGDALLLFTLRTCGDTFVGVVRENIVFLTRLPMITSIIRPVIVTALILLIPLIAKLTSAEFGWTPSDFFGAGSIIFVTALAFELVVRRSGSIMYRLATAATLLGMFLLLWFTLAVGIIGSEDNPSNVLYLGVVALSIIGGFIANLEPRAMSRALTSMALVMVAIPLLVCTGRSDVCAEPPGLVGVIGLHGCFVALFAVAGVLFRKASNK